MYLEEWGVIDSAVQETRWAHESAESRGGIGSCSPLLHRMEYLFPGLAFPSEPVAQLPPWSPAEKQSFSTTDSILPTNQLALSMVLMLRAGQEKVRLGLPGTVSGPAREGGDCSPGLAHPRYRVDNLR